MEHWKVAKGFPQLEVSSLGNPRNAQTKKVRSCKPHKKNGYRHIKLDGKNRPLAPIVLNTFVPNPAPHYFNMCDHINHEETSNNEITNLRHVNRTMNGLNTGAKGAILRPSGNWEAHVKFLGKQRHLGTYPTQDKAEEISDVVRSVYFQVLEKACPLLEEHFYG